jgi:hypothetical protein
MSFLLQNMAPTPTSIQKNGANKQLTAPSKTILVQKKAPTAINIHKNGANPQQYLATSYHNYHQREITPCLSYIAVHQA